LGNKIADPACGTGGFLLGAYQYIVTQLDKEKKKDLKADEDGFIRSSVSSRLNKKVRDNLNDNLYGYDIDVTMVRLGLMNLMMHGVDEPHIDYKDTLSKSFNELNKYNIVMANPPFTGSIDKSDINESLKYGGTKTELLFVEQIYNLLKMGGTAGVIVPQGVLFGSGNAFVEVRKMLVEQCELKAVIAMPSGVFKPYAGVSTAILIFTKGGETENVWFYNMESDGYSLDDRRSKLEGYGDLQEIVKEYKKRNPKKENDRKAKFFFVPKEDIAKEKHDLSMSRYKEDVFEEIPYDKPADILKKLNQMEKEIEKELKELERMLG
jgi:type I restriction enzyme M protein